MRLSTSIRSRSTAATLEAARQLMPALGISRLTDITRLDRTGVPVHVAIRPRGRTLRVHSGKALQPEEAKVGALMEAIEFAMAERASQKGCDATLPLAALVAQLPGGLSLVDFCPLLGARMPAARPVDSVCCEDLATGKPALLPAELVFVPADTGSEPPMFGWSTNGLASGNSLEEATLHALLEVLERDAVTLNRARDTSAAVRHDTLPTPLCDWATDWRRLGIALHVRCVPNVFGLPCFEAYLHEPASTDVNLAVGSGLHFDRHIALVRAVCEAAQSRVGTIHGGRDDLTLFYGKYDPAQQAAGQQAESRLLAALAMPLRWTTFDAVPHQACSAPETMLQTLLQQLGDRGFPQVFRRCMSDASSTDVGLHVIKLVVPRCEVLVGSHVRMGRRLLAHASGHG